jgi:hypothetical protein
LTEGLPGSGYNREQEEAIRMVHRHITGLSAEERAALHESVSPYLEFRQEVSRFQAEHLSATCTLKCFLDSTSACCGREGILTFFADVVINCLQSDREGVEDLLRALAADKGGASCVYLGEKGCVWKLKPIVCEMFLCDHVKEEIFAANLPLRQFWDDLRKREKAFTFPDRSVLFDELESLFLHAGLDSPLMYCHKSPGLLLLKEKHGVGEEERTNVRE